jgi:Lon-like protease
MTQSVSGSGSAEDTSLPNFQRATSKVIVGAAVVVVLSILGFLIPAPFVVYSPGPVVDVLGTRESDGKEIVQVSGHPTYYDDGKLEMTTVFVTSPDNSPSVFEVAFAWISNEAAVVPRGFVYNDEVTNEDTEREGAVDMVQSQDAATATALTALGYQLRPIIEVLDVSEDLPADGKLEVRDRIVAVNGIRVDNAQDVVETVVATEPGDSVVFSVRRETELLDITVTPEDVDGAPRVGIIPGVGYRFPFKVAVNISGDIGGPSAGLMFSLSIYDTLTPGSLTDGETLAGTGEINEKGEVGPIGGIQQKIVAARDSGAKLFFVPEQNCEQALGAPNGSMRLVRVTTMEGALEAINKWTADRDAVLPTCEAS